MHALWPFATVNRYLNFYSLFRAKRTRLFALYEQQEGEYHGPDATPTPAPASTSVANSDGESEADFIDEDFV